MPVVGEPSCRILLCQAPAKVNLHLAVLGRLDDGHHRIETVFQTIDLCDTLRLQSTADAGLQLHCRGPLAEVAPAGSDNLAARAATAWFAAADQTPALRIELHKRIPAGAGLGGGSSDAAAVLRGLQRLHPGRLSDAALHDIAAGLGADVAFFLYGGTAYGSGRGEDLQQLDDLPRRACTLYMPRVTCPTGAVYQALRPAERQDRELGLAALQARLRAADPAPPHNALEAPAARLAPAVGALLRTLRERHGCVWLSGSGSCCVVAGEHPPLAGVRSWQVHYLPAAAARACTWAD